MVTHSYIPAKASNFALSILTTGLVGESLINQNLTGHPVADLVIKIGLPFLSGILSPLVKEWIETRRHKRQIKRNSKPRK